MRVRLGTLLLLGALPTRAAVTQQAAAAVVGARVTRAPAAQAGPRGREQRLRVAASAGRGARVGRHALVGALVGAGAGVVASFIVTSAPHVQDHSEDALVYMLLVPGGAILGAVVGTVVGLVRTR